MSEALPVESQVAESQPPSNPPPELGRFRDIVNATLGPDFKSRTDLHAKSCGSVQAQAKGIRRICF